MKIDIFITAYLRPQFTMQTLKYLKERTKHPYRLFIIHNGGNEEALIEYEKDTFLVIDPSYNVGIHAAWNIALALAESEYFITSDNDIYVPDTVGTLNPATADSDINPYADWLTRMVGFMKNRPDYGAISLHPHVFIGAAGIDPKDPEDVKERNMCGAVMRIMKRDAVWKAGGWEKWVRTGRNHEERTICSRLQTAGYKVGIASRIRAYHPFGDNWGYPEDFTPEMQGHNPALKEEVKRFDNIEAYDNKTWLPK